MSGFKKLLVRAFLPVAATLFSTHAMAATIIGTLNSVGTGDSITMHAVMPNGTPFATQVLAGIANFTRTGGTDTTKLAGASDGSFLAFCLEPYEEAVIGQSYTYNVDTLANADGSSLTGGIGSVKATEIAQLFGAFAPNLAASMSAIKAAALQVAIWEIVSESATNPLNVYSGNTYFGTPGSSDVGDVLSLAQSYVSYVSTANSNAAQAQGLEALTINGKQDFLAQVVSTAPEPATWMMMILGFGMVGRVMRTRRRAGAIGMSASAA